MRDLHAMQPATRADWATLAKTALIMDAAIGLAALLASLLGGHA